MKIWAMALVLAGSLYAADENLACKNANSGERFIGSFEQAVEFFSERIKKCDVQDHDTLVELAFRRACACLEIMEDLEDEERYEELFLQAVGDFSYIAAVASPASAVAQSASLFIEFYNTITESIFETIESLDEAIESLEERWLQQLIQNDGIKGKELRLQVIQRCHEDEHVFASFQNEALLRSMEPDLILGYEVPYQFQIQGIVEDEEGNASIKCSISMIRDGGEIQLEREF
jgi:hypothetical protein